MLKVCCVLAHCLFRQRDVVVELLDDTQEQVQLLEILVAPIVLIQTAQHQIQVVNHKSRYHHAEEHDEGANQPLGISSRVQVSQADCGKRGEDEVR